MSEKETLNRRGFLKIAAIAGVGLAIEIFLPGCSDNATPTVNPSATPGVPTQPEPTGTQSPTAILEPTAVSPSCLTPSVYVMIGNDGIVTITASRSEIGQGVRTTLPMALAEELDADWAMVRVEQATGDKAYGDQTTGGSKSIQECYMLFRRAGAVAREMLIAAAAQTWGVEAASCVAKNGKVSHTTSGRELEFAALVDKAASLPIPIVNDVKTKASKDFYIIGTRIGRVENPAIVSGQAVYGMDVKISGMLYAAVARSPVIGGTVASFTDQKAREVAGVKDVVKITSGVAVVAENTWAAFQGRNALDVSWNEGKNASLNSAELERSMVGNASNQPAPSGKLAATYVVPYLAHATMEPMNCTADVRADVCEVWAPTQNPQAVKSKVRSLTQLPEKAITVYVPPVGGAFGRRLEMTLGGGSLPPACDYVAEAVQISKAVGAPVKVVWTREDDFRNDIYHPLTVIKASASLDDVNSMSFNRSQASASVPLGNWRSVGNVADAFAHESFFDEFAAAIGADPYELRRTVLNDRARAVLELAATKAGWGTSLPQGVGRGIAYHATWGVTHVAQVAEVSVDGDGKVRAQRVVCAVDCGTPVNPDVIEAQMEGGIIFGLTNTLKASTSIENGRVKETNFDAYPLLRLDESPQIEVYIVPSSASPTGIGEMSNPVIAPAVANAIFAAIGKRVRRLPILAPAG